MADPGAHDRIAHAGRAGLLAALLALVLVARPVLRSLFGPRPAGPSRAVAFWLALPDAARSRLAALAFSLPVGFCLAVVPIAVTAQSLHRVPGAGALLCESGRLAEHGYGGAPALTSGRSSHMIGCLDRQGRVIPDDRLHERTMRWIVLGFWLPLAGLLYPIGRKLRWGRAERVMRGTLRQRV